jgi:hypothetical protein
MMVAVKPRGVNNAVLIFQHVRGGKQGDSGGGTPGVGLTNVSTQSSATITFTGLGTVASRLSGSINISEQVGNALQAVNDGLYVAAGAGAIKYDTAQSLNTTEQNQALSNLGISRNILRYDAAQSLNDTQKNQALSNLGITSDVNHSFVDVFTSALT